jgi:ABC-type arginine transport system permease subunit
MKRRPDHLSQDSRFVCLVCVFKALVCSLVFVVFVMHLCALKGRAQGQREQSFVVVFQINYRGTPERVVVVVVW